MSQHLHLLKLSAGTESVDSLIAWQESRLKSGAKLRHVTRMWPKRGEELLDGGSIYWVIKGAIRARQRIAALEEVDHGDGVRRCGIVLTPGLIRTVEAPRRPFQGWRYLQSADAPPDLPKGRAEEEPLPAALAGALAEIGVL